MCFASSFGHSRLLTCHWLGGFSNSLLRCTTCRGHRCFVVVPAVWHSVPKLLASMWMLFGVNTDAYRCIQPQLPCLSATCRSLAGQAPANFVSVPFQEMLESLHTHSRSFKSSLQPPTKLRGCWAVWCRCQHLCLAARDQAMLCHPESILQQGTTQYTTCDLTVSKRNIQKQALSKVRK